MQNKYSQILKQKMILFTKMESFDLKKKQEENNKFLSYFFSRLIQTRKDIS